MFRRQVLGFLLVAWAMLATIGPAHAEDPYHIAWVRQLGTYYWDRSYGVSADGLGNVYMSGFAEGSLGGPDVGRSGAFVSKYDAAGNLLWTRQPGTSDDDKSYGVSADGLGSVYISGYTRGSIGGPNAGKGDAFLSKYDGAGNLLWAQQLGTSDSDSSFGVSADGVGKVYIAGYTYGSLGGANAGQTDAFVSKYDGAGNLRWTRQLGTTHHDKSYGASADALGNVYIVGETYGSLGGPNTGLWSADAFVSKYDAAGNLHWTRQLGTDGSDYGKGVSADGAGNVYISGYTDRSLGGPNAGVWSLDAFVSKYDDAGNLLWIRQLGTSVQDYSYGVSADGLGNVYMSGWTWGSLGGPSAGSYDAFVSKYDGAGNFLWTRQLGTSAWEEAYGVSADALGSLYISGLTKGSLGGAHIGWDDAFIAKLVVPEPGTSALALASVLFVVLWRGKVFRPR